MRRGLHHELSWQRAVATWRCPSWFSDLVMWVVGYFSFVTVGTFNFGLFRMNPGRTY